MDVRRGSRATLSRSSLGADTGLGHAGPSPPLSHRDRPAYGLPPVPLVLSAGLAADQHSDSLRNPRSPWHRLLLVLRPAAWADGALPARRSVARSRGRHLA